MGPDKRRLELLLMIAAGDGVEVKVQKWRFRDVEQYVHEGG